MSSNTGDAVNEISNLLEKTEVAQQNIVSFKGKGLKLDQAEDAKIVIDAIKKSSDLQVLELSGNTVGVEAVKAIAEALKEHSELERCLWADMFTGRLRSEIPPSLTALGDAMIMANTHLVEIDLSHNAFGPVCLQSLEKLLTDEACYTLEVLKFDNNGMGIGGRDLSKALLECHLKSSGAGKPLSLKVFKAGRNRLENPGAIALAEAFKTIGTLEEIHMPQNGINHEGITALADAVRNNKNLKHINLNDNTFSDKGGISMAKAIKEIDSLEVINFGDCLVRTDGATHIGDALKTSNPHLRQLILSFGEVQLDGAIRVCEGIAGKEMLELVDLNGNQFGPDGVDEITDMMKEFGHLPALGSLSDDEEVDSDEEDNEEYDQDEESEEQPEALLTNGDTSLSAEDFPENVTAGALLATETSKRNEIVQEAILKLHGDAEACVDACVKLSNLLLTPNAPNKLGLEATVMESCNEYLRAAVKYCEDKPMVAINRILIRAGLLKSEDKTVKALAEPRPLLQVLENALMQPYFPRSTKTIVRAMVAKSCKIWDKNYDLQSQMLKILY